MFDEVGDVIVELFRADDGGPAGRIAKKTTRILSGAVQSAAAKGSGPITIGFRASDYLLEQAGVPEDTILRTQLRREIDDVDRGGGFGVRVLDDDQAEHADGGPSATDHGSTPPPADRAVVNVIDP